MAYQEMIERIREVTNNRFGADIEDEKIKKLLMEVEEDFHVLRELRNRLAKAASLTDCLAQFVGEAPERIGVLRQYLDEEVWCLSALGEEEK